MLEIRLQYTLIGLAWTHNLVPKQVLRSSNWLMRSELGYFARSLISGINDGATTLKGIIYQGNMVSSLACIS